VFISLPFINSGTLAMMCYLNRYVNK